MKWNVKKLLSIGALATCLLAQADERTDFPVELLGDLNGMSVPRTRSYTTGEIIKDVSDWIKAKNTNAEAKKYFFHAVGELLEIVDKDDFIKLWRDFGYEFYSGEKVDRKVNITGFYNESGAPSMNNAVSRVCSICFDPLKTMQSDLNKVLGLNWYDDSFELAIKNDFFGITVVDLGLYVDRGDVVMVKAFGKAAEGALFLLRGMDISMDYPAVVSAVDKLLSDVQDKRMDFVSAFDASQFARMKVGSVSDLKSAREAFASAIELAGTGDALVRKRTDTNPHLIQYSDGDDSEGSGLAGVVQMLVQNKDTILSFIDQLISPVDISSAVVADGVLELTYTGGTLSPTIGSVKVDDAKTPRDVAKMPYDVAGVASATEAGTYEMTLVGYGRSTGTKKVAWKIVIPPPSISGDAGADVTDDGKGGFKITPSADVEDVDVTIPLGVDAAKVVVEVSPDTKSVKPNGTKFRIVRQVPKVGLADITKCLDIPSPDASGVVDLTRAVVKEEIVREALDEKEGAVVNVGAGDVSITTAKTRPGLVYTLIEGSSLDGMDEGESRIGDGAPWTPAISVKGGMSGFYSIRVTK